MDRLLSYSGPIVTAVAWLVIVASAVLSLVSTVALLMLVVGSHGTASTTLLGFLSVVVLPTISLLAGSSPQAREP